jgi:hypothetical protein
MEINFWLVSLPAFISLSLKGGIYAYAHLSRTHSVQTRLYLLTLFAFSIQNLAEIGHFYTFIERGHIPTFEVNMFYAATITALAFLFHLALALVYDPQDRMPRRLAHAMYVYALVLIALIFLTPWLINGYTPIGRYTVTRIAGPLYGLFELYAIGICLAVVGILALGIKRQQSSYKRNRVKIVLIAVIPLTVVLTTVLVSLHIGVRLFNASVILPTALTFFLAVSAYATHQYRLFDIDFFLPWSKVRKRKTAFYDRIRATVAEIADLSSVNQVVNRLADTLRCPVALIGGQKPVLALAGESFGMARFPIKELRKIDSILVANEIAETMPEAHALMTRHKVAVIVPYHPHSETAASWMLLGERFSEEIYTPLDFKVVEELFDRMGDLFLDKLLLMRTQLTDAQREMRALHHRLAHAWEELDQIRKENQSLREQNSQLMSEYATTVESTVLGTKAALAGEPTAEVEAIAPAEKSLDDYVEEFEARIIGQVLKRCEGNKAKAARLLGLRPNTLHYKIERYGIGKDEKH